MDVLGDGSDSGGKFLNSSSEDWSSWSWGLLHFNGKGSDSSLDDGNLLGESSDLFVNGVNNLGLLLDEWSWLEFFNWSVNSVNNGFDRMDSLGEGGNGTSEDSDLLLDYGFVSLGCSKEDLG